ncbi:metallo-beta-lactamase family protein [Vibrio cholerae]|nr:metallo-beta-lactamase family protein [Vibrio cholerae]
MAATPLTLDVYNADGNSFHVNATGCRPAYGA